MTNEDLERLAIENLMLRKKLDRAMRDMRLLEDAKDRYDALYAHAMDALTGSEAKYRNLAENLSEGLALTDPALRITYANPGLWAILGFGPEDPAPGSLEDLVAPGDREAFLAYFRDLPGGHAEHREFTLVHRDGSPVQVFLSTSALRDAHEACSGFLVLFADLRAHRLVTETRRYAQKMESLVLMAGSIAHDFNNIFQALVSSLDIAAMQAKASPDAVRTLDAAQGALRRATALSCRMMDFSGMVISHREPVRLPELLAKWAPELFPAPENRRLDMSFQEAPAISADPANLRRVVEAMLENAWEAMDEARAPQGRVWLRLWLDRGAEPPGNGAFWASPRPGVPETVCLEIGNDGPCPPPEVLPRMFDPFFTTRALGRGLGLASALGLLLAQGAGVQVLPGAGGGIAFRLHFPPLA